MRRFFTVSSSRRVLAAATLSRWQSETAAPKAEENGNGGEQNTEKPASMSPAAAEFEKLKKAVAENKSAIEATKREILYTAANAQNARRGFQENVSAEKFKAESAFAKELLESVDALDKVCGTIATYRLEKPDMPAKVTSLLNGVDLSLKVVQKVLSRYGVAPIEIKVGDAFNEETMKSILTTPATEEIKAGQVSEIVKTGYTRKGEVLRQAEVGVAENPE